MDLYEKYMKIDRFNGRKPNNDMLNKRYEDLYVAMWKQWRMDYEACFRKYKDPLKYYRLNKKSIGNHPVSNYISDFLSNEIGKLNRNAVSDHYGYMDPAVGKRTLRLLWEDDPIWFDEETNQISYISQNSFITLDCNGNKIKERKIGSVKELIENSRRDTEKYGKEIWKIGWAN